MATTPPEPVDADDDQANHDMYQRVGVDDDQPAQNPETGPRATSHLTGVEPARENETRERAG